MFPKPTWVAIEPDKLGKGQYTGSGLYRISQSYVVEKTVDTSVVDISDIEWQMGTGEHTANLTICSLWNETISTQKPRKRLSCRNTKITKMSSLTHTKKTTAKQCTTTLLKNTREDIQTVREEHFKLQNVPQEDTSNPAKLLHLVTSLNSIIHVTSTIKRVSLMTCKEVDSPPSTMRDSLAKKIFLAKIKVEVK